MVYYALLKWQTNEYYWRYLLAAPNSETIDEWWRVVSEKDECNFKRLAPDFYSWDKKKEVYDAAPEFMNRIMFSLLQERDGKIICTISQPERANVVSGGSYYIRSKSNPEYYWLEKDGKVWSTKLGRTRFVLRIEGAKDMDNTVLIGTDSISIAPVGARQKYVDISDEGELVVSGHSSHMYYSDLKRSFLAQGEHGQGSPSLAITKVGESGEEWELVE
ncbi:hypothetical protein FZEAL_5893 [Fusarium zealandicum]|uniref:Uncharacterized protein n=1 Tax=Fusarium zealandicum TaxID=1053134 RepID=A0A8H4UJR3_9HYPO|nr:hypothetical protein FZEAL_5893 [Fusarium zealandicum]